jgi:hypothetical protein
MPALQQVGHLDHYLSLTAKDDSASDAYAVVLGWKGSVFARQQQMRERGRLAKQADLSRQRVELDDVTRRQSQLALASEKDRKGLPSLEKRREELERALAEKSPDVRGRLAGRDLTPEALCKALPPDVALVDFLEYNHTTFGKKGRSVERRLAAFVVRRGGLTRFDLGPAKPIREVVNEWRVGLGRKRLDPAATLRKIVWLPLAAELKKATTVIISPDGALAWLPFAALPGRKEKTFLIEEVALATVAVPQALPALLASKPAAGEATLLVVGDVDYDGPRGAKQRSREGKWAHLPGTRS